MKTILVIFSLVSAAAVVPIEAKNKTTTKVGCVEARHQQYELSTISKKGKPRHYVLVGHERFADDVGQRVKVTGHAGKKTINVDSIESLSARCR
jgi:hypothetical protein